jgi:hypothetical protein
MPSEPYTVNAQTGASALIAGVSEVVLVHA